MSLQSWLADRGFAQLAPEINVFFLAEMSAHAELRARLEFHDQPYRLLWRLESQSSLEQHAPCLFQSHAGSAFDDWLASAIDAFPLSILLTREGIDSIGARLRRFTKLQDSDGRYLLRLGDPASLRLYLDSIAHTPETVAKLFGHKGVEAFYLHAPRIALSRQVQPLFEQGWDHPGREGYLLWRDAPLLSERA
ncbi:DUF4123 domain-containing protein [Serratia marcescens]|uniref:DUF4123 domain-containing protein n=1 Tax=Serratia marcescens TaxID=615 RepID=UPI004035FCB8